MYVRCPSQAGQVIAAGQHLHAHSCRVRVYCTDTTTCMLQYRLIQKDGVCICKYAARTFDAVARTSHLRHDNYFYYNCLTGRYARDNCPAYLEPAHFDFLRDGGLDRLEIVNGTFLETLRSRQFTKVSFVCLQSLA